MTAKVPPIGIDLGTTYSCVAVYEHGKVEIIVNDQGERTTPSCVAFTEDERLIGGAARNQIVLNPENTIFDAKRLLGRRYNDQTVQEDMKHWPFKVIRDGDKPKIQVESKGETKTFYPEQISAMVLEKMKGTAESYLGETVTDAVVTVPAYFSDSQRNSTKIAAEICGLNVLQLLNEPTAAAVAYGFDKKLKEDTTVLVFDFGGGTLDVSILSIKQRTFKVKSTAGNTHLGGNDLDTRLVNYFVEEFKSKYKKDLTVNKRAVQRLRSACERAKKQLSFVKEVSIDIDALFDGIDFHMSITRACFEDINKDIFECILDPLQSALTDAKLRKPQINEVVLVGGSTRIPKVQQLVQDFFDGKKLNKSINPDEAVAYGAALQAAVLKGNKSYKIKDLVLVDVTPLSLGIQTNKEHIMSVVLKRNTRIPTKRTQEYTTIEDNQTIVRISVYEGEREFAKDNYLLGTFYLSGIPPAPKGKQKIDVTFDLDINGILKVTAVNRSTRNANSITISYDNARLKAEEVSSLIAEAEMYKAEDNRRRRAIEAKNALESYCSKVKDDVEDLGNTVSEHNKMRILDKCNEVSDWLKLHGKATKEEFEGKQRELELIHRKLLRS